MSAQREAMLPETFKIRKAWSETGDTFTFTLARGRKGFRFEPGQFNMLYAFGVGEVPISISGDPGRSAECVHTIRAVGPVTRVLEALKAGAVVGVRGPFGTAWPVQEARGGDLVLVAGGIGLAPLRPVLYHALSHRKQYGKIVLLYGARTPADVLYGKELERWAGARDVQVEVTVDSATRRWKGHVGVVPKLIAGARFDGAHAVAMLCGPEIMMRYAIPELQKRGVGDGRIFVSMERNMKCAVGFCGHCQYGGAFICKDGPVFSYDRVRDVFLRKEF